MSMLIFYREACILSNESLQLQKKQPTLRTKMTKNNKSNSTRAQSGHRKRVVSPAQVAQDADPEERSRRERNKLEKRDRIRQAAWELFISQGFDSTTTRQVATRAGVASGTLFLYATDKVDLLFLVMHDRLADATDRAFATLPTKAPLIDQLIHLFCVLYRMYAEQPPALAMAFIATLPGARGPNADRVNALTFAFMSRLSALLRDGQARGDVRADLPLQTAASSVFACHFMRLLGWASGMMALPTEKDPSFRELMDVLLRGIAQK